MTDSAYDVIPYPEFSFRESSPENLALIAGLFGHQTPPLQRATVLELGAASGSNLIPIAIANPQTKCIGVDLSQRQVEAGQKTIATLGLKNVQLKHLDIMQIGKDFGTFDYIICHGVFSWVAADVRAKILEICVTNLSDKGVAYVSYNTLPGWNMNRTIRDMMLYHTRQIPDPALMVGQARAFLDFAARAVAHQNSPYSLFLKKELERLRAEPDAYLFHDHLEAENYALYFHEFMRQADTAGLRYVGEAVFHSMTGAEFDAPTQETLRSVADKMLAMEQYLDFLKNRTFRATILCHKKHALTRRIEPAALKNFQFATSARLADPAADSFEVGECSYVLPNGSELRTSDPAVKALLQELSAAWPAWLGIGQIQSALRLSKKAAVKTLDFNEAYLCGLLLQLFQQGVVEVHTAPPNFTLKISARPNAYRLARIQSESGAEVTNARQERVRLPDAFRFLLPLCDGTRDRAALAKRLEELLGQGVLQLREGKILPEPGPQRTQYFQDSIEKALQFFARRALLQS